ncbi:MAG: hypothetical protein MUE36_02310 [Acidimicrobiales bacterium]|jgi:hypothetical protein|nr:hypothetical protein [Acidimicrobiales bacterium]
MNRAGRLASSVAVIGAIASPAAIVANSYVSAEAHNANPIHVHNAFSKSVILEQFGVTATEIFLGWEFQQSASAIGNQVLHGDSYCYHSAFPGWAITNCEYQAYKNTASYGQEVKADMWGAFYSNFGPAYEMHTYGHVSNAGNAYKFGCDLTFGSLPVLWSNVCSGAW